MRRAWAVLLVLASCATTSFAHYNMLFPDKPWAKKGEKVTFTYQFGHPFEHELFAAPKPVGLVVLLPTGKKEILDIDKTLTKIEVPGADGKKVAAWTFDYTPTERGDHIFVLRTPPIKLEDEGHSVEDFVKVVLHVQTQNGWDSTKGPFDDDSIDIQPHTRPYGLLPGMVFSGRVAVVRKQRGDGIVKGVRLRLEIEKYNEKPVKNPPPDELITFRARTDKEGFFVATLPEAGWWGVTALAKESDVTRRATLWVHVDEKK
jgi:uncharacterized GH25 family protein